MKLRSTARISFPLAATIAALLAASPPQAHAIVFFWDANQGASGIGGSGTWDVTSSLWRSGSSTGTLSLWPNTSPNTDEARLTSIAGTVTLNADSDDIHVNIIRFGVTGCIIDVPTSGTAKLVLSGTAPTIAVGGNDGIILADISGTGLTKTGAGTLVLGGNNSFGSGTMAFGATTVNNGYIRLTSNKALGNYDNITLTSSGSAVNGLEVSDGVNCAYNILTGGRGNPTTTGYALKNVSGDNTWSGNITASAAGGGYGILSDAGTLTITGGITSTVAASGTRTFDFVGAGNFVLAGIVSNGPYPVAISYNGAGTSQLTLSGSNTYTGNTTATAGTLTLGSTGQLKFMTGADVGTGHNAISGEGTVNLNGSFVIDTAATDATDLTSGNWQIENVTSLTGAYGSTFTVVDWTDAGNDKWTKSVGTKNYTFDETTGTVTLGDSDVASTTTTLTSSANPANLGTSVTFTATVTSTTTPTGTVNFLDGVTNIGSGTLDGSGVATLATSILAAGSHSITASYAGTPGFASSTSSPLAQVIRTDYEGWVASFPGFSNNLPAQDHDGDGQINQQEYAFGMDPTSGASVNPITVPLNKTTGKFSYTRRATPATSGLVYTVKTSTTLSGWTTDSGATESVTGTVGDVQTVEVTLTPALLSQANLFVRVEAE